MYQVLFFIGVIFTIISFFIFVLSLMKFFPIWIAAPVLLMSIIFTVHCINEKKRFRGFS